MPRRSRPHGFTLIEILVVILIIVLVSAATLPVVLPALAHREIGDTARLLQATLAGARDLSLRANAPRGLRFLPDPQVSVSTPGALASNRMIAIEPAPNHSEGYIAIDPAPLLALTDPRLIVHEDKWVDYIGTAPPPPLQTPNYMPPTSWYWNIRQGDRLRIGNAGAVYTIVGPMRIGIRDPATGNLVNPERFINDGPPSTPPAGPLAPAEYLILVNGRDDDGDGYVDESFDGIDNDGDGITDPGYNGIDDDPATGKGVDDPAELFIRKDPTLGIVYNSPLEYEQEQFVSPAIGSVPTPARPVPLIPGAPYIQYQIFRRPIPSPGAREVALSPGVVIDLTTLDLTVTGIRPERSRLPIDRGTGFVELLFYPNGQVIPSTPYGNEVDPFGNDPILSALPPFYHFWLAERGDLYEPGPAAPRRLPVPKDTPLPSLPPGVPPPSRFLEGERRLITLNPRTGSVTTHVVENGLRPDSSNPTGFSRIGFSYTDPDLPYREAQEGKRDVP